VLLNKAALLAGIPRERTLPKYLLENLPKLKLPTNIPNALRVARRHLEPIPNIKLLQDWFWNKKIAQWVLSCELSVSVSRHTDNPYVPRVTNWYVTVSPSYPLGNISFFPAKDNSIVHTFQHQRNNSRVDDDLPWRWGSICLDLNVKVLGRFFVETEPFSTEARLTWYFLRSLKWLEAAAKGDFAKPGEPFELPDFPSNKDFTLAFSENASLYEFWKGNKNNKAGLVTLVESSNPNILAVKSFLNQSGKQILTPSWGAVINAGDNKKEVTGIWMLLKDLPIIDPWQPPSTFGELADVLKKQGIDFYKVLQPLLSSIRDGEQHFLLLGFSIPTAYGEKPIRIHWQGFLLPVLSSGLETQKGYRPNETGKFVRDKLSIISRDIKLDWITSENWAGDQIIKRGAFPKSFAKQKILVIGCGAVGSMVTELLVRGNVKDIILVDGEDLEVGNLVRHTLVIDDTKKSKAKQLAQRLNSINPHANVIPFTNNFPLVSENGANILRSCDLVIDCTANDSVLIALSTFSWGEEKQIISLSLNYGATKSFIYICKKEFFPVEDFSKRIRPHLIGLGKIDELPRDGIGCWNPVFPARADDVWLLISASIKTIVELLENPEDEQVCKFIVFEQILENGYFAGIKKTE
jgi:hypothetical protein